MPVDAPADRWSRWLLQRRDAGSERQRAAVHAHLAGIRDRVLAGAGPLAGATLLDVGTGDGLIGLAALEQVGEQGHVVFSDVSAALLARCREQVDERGATGRASFVPARADDLHAIGDASVDVVTTRSVLIYVSDKPRAFAEFARVLAPGGRISLFEPINRLMYPEPAGRFWGYDVGAVAELAAKVTAQFAGSAQERAAMLGFDDRDLVEFALGAGFTRVRCRCEITVEPDSTLRPVSFDALLGASPNPNAPTVTEAITAALTAAEQERFVAALHDAYQARRAIGRTAVAYLVAELEPVSPPRSVDA